MRSTIIFSIVSLLAQASAQLDSTNLLGSHGAYVATKVRRNADLELNASGYLKRRIESYYSSTQPSSPGLDAVNKDMAPAPSATTMPMASGSLNLNPMMNDTQAACASVLANATPDDTGLAACFNVNFFDNSTGKFQANMLVYELGSRNGGWNQVQGGSVQLNLNFPGAETSMMNNATATSAAPAATSTVAFRRALDGRANVPVLMEAYTLMGSINAPFNASFALMNATIMREALTPMISMTATGANNSMLSTNLTAPAGAAFVSGWFSDADIAMRTAVAAAAANPAPFVLPGVTLAIPLGLFPIGLIVTSIWVALFIGAVGYGTLGRMQWRSAYRAQKAGASGK